MPTIKEIFETIGPAGYIAISALVAIQPIIWARNPTTERIKNSIIFFAFIMLGVGWYGFDILAAFLMAYSAMFFGIRFLAHNVLESKGKKIYFSLGIIFLLLSTALQLIIK